MLGSLRRAGAGAIRRQARFYATEELTAQDEATMAGLRNVLKTKSFVGAEKVDMSPELREKVNTEFKTFLKEFVFEHRYQDEVDDIAEKIYSNTGSIKDMLSSVTVSRDSTGNIKGLVQFPKLQVSESDEPYTEQELYRRRLFHAAHVGSMGATVSDVYRPHEDVFKPPQIEKTSVATLLAAGAHLGHSTSRLRANCLPFVHGEREGIHIIDLDQTLTYLRRAARVVEGVAEKGGIILFVGTRDGQERSVEVAATRSHGYYVHTRWTPGTLTNAVNISGQWDRLEVNMADEPTGRELGPHVREATVKPDMVVVLNPVENRALLSECLASRVPTIGIIDTDSEPSLVSYPIPANDDSLRTCDLILGVLANAAKRGRAARLGEYASYKESEKLAKSGNGFNANTPRETTDDVSPQEHAMAMQNERA